MEKNIASFNGKIRFMLLFCMCFSFVSFAQSPDHDSTKTNIVILNNEYGEYIQSEGNSVHKLVHNVKLLHGSDTLYCDSAFFYQTLNSVEAFGDVAIYQADGTKAFADYMRYTGNDKQVFMRGTESDAQLSDVKGNNLWSKEITYNLTTKIGTYNRGGTLQSDATIVSSRSGIYNLRTKDARFKKNVEVNDPKYHVISEDLGYNTESKIVRFFGPSVVTNDQSVLQTSNGVYDTKDKSSHFVDRSSILNKGQYIEADTLDYDHKTGLGIATGNVIAIDTARKSTLYCDYARYNEITGHLWAYGRPLMKILNGKDSLFIKADTFFSAPIVDKDSSVLTAQDSLQMTLAQIRAASGGRNDTAGNILPDSAPDKVSIPVTVAQDSTIRPIADTIKKAGKMARDTGGTTEEKNTTGTTALRHRKQDMDHLVYAEKARDTLPAGDTTQLPLNLENQHILDSTSATYHNRPDDHADSSSPRYFIGYHHVLIYSDSLQGKCDSIRYSQHDSLMRMYIDPVLWPGKSQITGDEIHILTKESTIRELFVPRNAIIISRSGPEKAGMFDQIQGNTIRGFFTDNTLDSLFAQPNASSIYYVKDDDGAYVGSSQASSEQIEIAFDSGTIQKIYYRQDVRQTMTPMKAVTPSALRLSRFIWREKERPKSLKEFLDGATLPHDPELLKQ